MKVNVLSVNNFMSNVINVVYPTRCPGCDGLIKKEELSYGFCKKCKPDLEMVSDNHCQKCGKELKVTDVEEEYCADCQRRKRYFQQGKAAFIYSGVMKKAMYRFKYSNRRCYGRIFAEMAVKSYDSWSGLKDIDGIVPVPMYNKKKRMRGYNQAEVIAEELGKMIHMPVYKNYVIRNRLTLPQKNLDDVQRRANLKNAFIIRKNGVKLRKILLVDDIFTTGSTMDEIAKVCRENGVLKIYCLCVCTGREV